MLWQKAKSGFFAFLIGAIAFFFLSGCGDMPEIGTAKKAAITRLVVGPYFSASAEQGLILHFQTDRPCVAGLRSLEKTQSITRYASSYGLAQALRIETQPGQLARCQLLLDDNFGPEIDIRGAPLAGAAVRIAFIGAPAQEGAYRYSDELLSRYPCDRIILAASPFNAMAPAEIWAESFFLPLANCLRRSPLMWMPSIPLHLPPALRPSKIEDSAWSEDIGCLHLIALHGPALRHPATSGKVLTWLDQDLAQSRPTIAWTAVVVSEPLFGERHINVRALETLEMRLERAGIPLVISGGSMTYHRTVPLAAAGEGRVRYAVAGCAGEGEKSVGREYTAVCSREVIASILSVDQGWLEWKAYGAGGRVVDSFRLSRDSDDTGEPVLDKQPILAQAQAILALRRETLAIARQACRAVADPTQPQTLTFRLANPSPQQFGGKLLWTGLENASWQPDPPFLTFSLAPGQETNARFTLSPTGKGQPPVFEVHAEGLGVARQPLLLVQGKSINLPLVDSPCRIDGSFETESFWHNALKLEDFVVTASDAKPSRTIFCRLGASDQGILLAIRCEAEKPAKIPCRVKERDGPVYEDESLEVFIDPTAQGKEYLQFSVNLAGAILDRSSHFGLVWNPPWQQAIRFADNYYDVEMLIPYRSLGLPAKPQPGDSIGLNVCRNDYRQKARKRKKDEKSIAEDASHAGLEVVQWAQTMGNNGRPGCYGKVTFTMPDTQKPAP